MRTLDPSRRCPSPPPHPPHPLQLPHAPCGVHHPYVACSRTSRCSVCTPAPPKVKIVCYVATPQHAAAHLQVSMLRGRAAAAGLGRLLRRASGGRAMSSPGRSNRLQGFSDPTVFCEFTPLAIKLNALNLGQVGSQRLLTYLAWGLDLRPLPAPASAACCSLSNERASPQQQLAIPMCWLAGLSKL